MHFMM